MVGFVDDENVEGEPIAGLRVTRLGVDVTEQALRAKLREPRHAHDYAREELERVGVQTVGATHLRHQLAVDDRELQAELLAHLVLPLQCEARRTDDHGGAGSVAQEQLLNNQACLDRLAQTHIVGEKQVGPRRSERTA